MTFAKNKLGDNLKKLRNFIGYTQDELAEILHFSKGNTISNYETGERIPDKETLVAYADFFDVTVDDIISGDFPVDGSLSRIFEKIGDKKEEIVIDFFNLFPRVNFSHNSFPDEYKKVYEIHESVFSKLEVDVSEELYFCFNEYGRIYDKYKNPLIMVNYINLCFIIGLSPRSESVSKEIMSFVKGQVKSKQIAKEFGLKLKKIMEKIRN